jgi:hypothetical protein
MWEGDGYQLCESDHPASELPPTPPESREELSERGNIPPASIQPVQASPSQHPDPSYDQVGGSDCKLKEFNLALKLPAIMDQKKKKNY